MCFAYVSWRATPNSTGRCVPRNAGLTLPPLDLTAISYGHPWRSANTLVFTDLMKVRGVHFPTCLLPEPKCMASNTVPARVHACSTPLHSRREPAELLLPGIAAGSETKTSSGARTATPQARAYLVPSQRQPDTGLSWSAGHLW